MLGPAQGTYHRRREGVLREHLDEVNQRLATEGLRLIDLADPDHVARYGLEGLVQERGPTVVGSTQLKEGAFSR